MATRKTKKQQENEQRAALLQRLRDLFTGATGDEFEDDGAEPMPTEFMAFVMATKTVFCILKDDNDKDCPGNEWLWHLWNLHNFKTPEDSCAWLFDNGVRE